MATLKRFRREQGWSMGELAKKLGVDISTVSRFEAGRHFPRPEMLTKISALSEGRVTANDFMATYVGEK